MLLRNESKLSFSVDINLIFDDGTEKHFPLSIGDKLNIVYRHNGDKISREGKLIDILPLFKSTLFNKFQECFCHYNMNPIAILRIDFSKEYGSDVKDIRIDDIIDIDVIRIIEFSEGTSALGDAKVGETKLGII